MLGTHELKPTEKKTGPCDPHFKNSDLILEINIVTFIAIHRHIKGIIHTKINYNPSVHNKVTD